MFYYIKLFIISILTMLGFLLFRPWLIRKLRPHSIFIVYSVGVVILFLTLTYYSVAVNRIQDVDDLFSDNVVLKRHAYYTKVFRTRSDLTKFEDIVFGQDTISAFFNKCYLSISFSSTILTQDRELLNSNEYLLELNFKCPKESQIAEILVDSAWITFGDDTIFQQIEVDTIATKRWRQNLGARGKILFKLILLPELIERVKLSFLLEPNYFERKASKAHKAHKVFVTMYKYMDSTMGEIVFPESK